MKKLICALLALSLVLAMTACGGKQTAETTAPAANIAGTMEELLNQVTEQRPVEFAGGVIPVDPLTSTTPAKMGCGPSRATQALMMPPSFPRRRLLSR